MKLLSVEMSRITALFHVTRPQGQVYLPQNAAALVERYAFAQSPQSFAELSAERVNFGHGFFDGSAIESLAIYEDGIVIASRSDTEIIDAFLADLMEWMQSELGLSMIKNRSIDQMYDSNLIVEADEKILMPLTALSGICAKISDMIALNTDLKTAYQPAGFTLAADQMRIPNLAPSAFRLERRFASEFSLNQFLSFAPLKTGQHMDILTELEGLF